MMYRPRILHVQYTCAKCFQLFQVPISKGAQGVTGLESKKLVSDDRMEAAAASAESEEDDEEDEDGLSDVDEVSGWIIHS